MIKKLLHVILLAGIALCAIGIPKQSFAADICYNQRSIGIHVCRSNPLLKDTCFTYVSPCLGTGIAGRGSNDINGNGGAETALQDCESKCFSNTGGPYPTPVTSVTPGICVAPYCVGYISPTYCEAQSYLAQCSNIVVNGVTSCTADVVISSCEGQGTGTACTESPTSFTYGCWGPGTNTPTPTQSGPKPTPTPRLI